jgi:diacylglycerol kinase
MKPYYLSLRYALNGIAHAFATERNLKLFLGLYLLSFAIAAFLGLEHMEWIVVVFSGGVFLAFELMNTSIEHFSDAFDDHSKAQDDIHEQAVRLTKDIAAGASLICAGSWGVVLLLTYWPHAMVLIGR